MENEIGRKIRELRKSAGLTQSELASRLGVQKAAVAKYESGEIENLKRSTIQKLALLFDVSPVVFIDPNYTEPFGLEIVRRYNNADDTTKMMVDRLLSYSTKLSKLKEGQEDGNT